MIEDKIKLAILEGVTLKELSLQEGKFSGYYSALIIKKYPHLRTLLNIKKDHRFRETIDKEVLSILIKEEKLSSTQIGERLGYSNVHIKKYVSQLHVELYNQLIANGEHRKYNSNRGKQNINWRNNKGKTYTEIYGEKAEEMKLKRSIWLKENNIRKFATRISKPQAMLYSIIKPHFQQAELEYEVITDNNKTIWLDIAIPDLKINIEYDGIYWHTKNKTTISLSDENRDEFLRNKGWRVFRIRSMRNLTEEELKTEFNRLQLI